LPDLYFKSSRTFEISDFENRETYWEMAIKKILQRPFLGYGAESGEKVYDLAFREEKINLEGLIIDRSHNLLLDILLWSGFVGLTFFLFWFISKSINLIRNKAWFNCYALSGFIFFSMFHPIGVVNWIVLLLIFEVPIE